MPETFNEINIPEGTQQQEGTLGTLANESISGLESRTQELLDKASRFPELRNRLEALLTLSKQKVVATLGAAAFLSSSALYAQEVTTLEQASAPQTIEAVVPLVDIQEASAPSSAPSVDTEVIRSVTSSLPVILAMATSAAESALNGRVNKVIAGVDTIKNSSSVEELLGGVAEVAKQVPGKSSNFGNMITYAQGVVNPDLSGKERVVYGSNLVGMMGGKLGALGSLAVSAANIESMLAKGDNRGASLAFIKLLLNAKTAGLIPVVNSLLKLMSKETVPDSALAANQNQPNKEKPVVE